MSSDTETRRADYERCVRFEQTTAARASTTTKQIDLGSVFLNSDLPKVWDRNFLWLGAGALNASAAEIIDATERELGQAGVDHRKFLVAAEHVSEDLARGLAEARWSRTELVTMVLRDAAVGERSAEVVELSAADYAGFNRVITSEFSDSGPEVVEQLVQLGLLMGNAANARFFVANADDKPVAGTHLYSDGSSAQIEDVGTLEGYRGRGLSRILMKHVIADAFDNGHDMVFLVAETDDWPKDFYARLGFEVVGRTLEFKPQDDDSSKEA